MDNSHLPPISPIWLGGFRVTAKFLFKRQFDGLWVQHESEWKKPEAPLLIYSNHPGWWDPITACLLARHYFAERRNYFPMDAAPLSKQPGFSKIGFLPVDREKTAGTRRFLKQARSILRDPGAALWMTPQGLLTDPRVRPVKILPGLNRIVTPDTKMLPMAVEYAFWNTKKPRALVRIGNPHLATDAPGELAAENLTSLLNELSIASQTRDDATFTRVTI